MPRSLYLLMTVRALVGFGHGYAYLTALVHASEIVTQRLRGMIIAVLNFCTISSILMCGAITMSLDKEKHGFGAMQWIGMAGMIYSIASLVFIPIFTRESPVLLIKQKKFDQAVALMCQLRHESSETWSIKNEYNELKTMVEEDEESSNTSQTSHKIFDQRNIRPLMLVTLLKVGSVLSFNFGVNMIRLNMTTMFTSEENVNSAVVVLMSIRMISAMATMFTIDAKGRRPHFLISYGGSAVLLIVMGIIAAFKTPSEMSWLTGLLQIAYEIVGGVGIGMVSDVYSSEAFNSVKKPNSIMFTTGVEFILQAAIIAITFDVATSTTFNWIFLAGSGVALLVITVFLHKELPETAKMSIRQTRTEFQKSGEIVFGGSKMPVQNITFS